ncbi:MAG: TIGR02117 family protein [Flavobacteriales bacterium]|nr:TIGR02117 family protein [Bacteroidales bacterium AH-315-I05]PCJ85271.1 MAG: TIGR02117 family protein [Flavobacteriales bacterium]
MIIIKKIVRIALWLIVSLVSLTVLYFLIAVLLTIIPANSDFTEQKKGINIFVISNGAHTDVCVPIKNKIIDWKTLVDTTDFEYRYHSFKYISFGWGDKGFYLETPTWAELKFSVAFEAMMLPSPTAMHVTMYDFILKESELVKKITISESQYKLLKEYIENTFALDSDQSVQPIDCCRYAGMNDNFYEAKGYFSLFKTCNVWTNNALKTAGVKTAVWAPFDKCVFYHLD